MIHEQLKEKMEAYINFGEGFLYDNQKEAIIDLKKKGNSGLILQGKVGRGKSRTGLYWYFNDCGGCISGYKYIKMHRPKPLYIITTAHKRDILDWEKEMIPFGISVNEDDRMAKLGKKKLAEADEELDILGRNKELYPGLKVVVDSWQNIERYEDIRDAYFIFDEDHVVSFGKWGKIFIKIARPEQNNKWIVMTATPADQWREYAPIFVACGFYKNQTEFNREHIMWDPWCKSFPKVKGYINTGRLIRLRNKITVQMKYEQNIDILDLPIICKYDVAKYNYLMKERFDIWKNEPYQNAAGLCYGLRRVCNEDNSRVEELKKIVEKHKKVIVFYNYDYELEMLKAVDWGADCVVDELNGHRHGELPAGAKWIYLCQYTAAAEAWNCTTTNVIVFFSQTYSYKILIQAKGRIDRLNTPYRELYYYHFVCKSPIDITIQKTLNRKKKFNEGKFMKDLNVSFEC